MRKELMNLEKLEKYLFWLMLIFACVSYAGYFFMSVRNRTWIMVSYARSNPLLMQSGGIFTLLIRFAKDVCAGLLIITELFSTSNTKRVTILLSLFSLIVFGTVVSVVHNYGIAVIISGIRMFLFFLALAMFFNGKNYPIFIVENMLKITGVLLCINTIAAMQQAAIVLGNNVRHVGEGSYRFMGFFPSAAAYGYFCLGVVLLLFSLGIKADYFTTSCKVFYAVAFIGCYLSGTRSSLINVLFILFAILIYRGNIVSNQKGCLFSLLLVPVFIIIVVYASNIASRGSILTNAITGGRLSLFWRYSFQRPITRMLFGEGLGAGSNTAAQFMMSDGDDDLVLLDGTFTTIIYQFGIIGVIAILWVIVSCTRKIAGASGRLCCAVFMGSVVLQCLTSNIFEDYAMLILIFLSYYILTDGVVLWSKQKNMKEMEE